MGRTVPGNRRRTGGRTQSYEYQSTVTLEQKWWLFNDAIEPCIEIVRELAKYQYYWDQRTIWLGENSHLKDTELYQERRAKRQAMTERWNEIRTEFLWHAENVQNHAELLGSDHFDEIRERYAVDYSRRGKTMDVYLVQWRDRLHWNPEPCPF